MDLDTLIHHYFGTDDPDTLSDDALARGQEALAIDFGIAQEPGRRFALWALMQMMGCAPDPDTAFEDADERRAAWRFARMTEPPRD